MVVVVLTLLAAADPECGWCACVRDLEDNAISDKRCRRPDWSCFDDPCASCAGLAWAPIRFGVAYALLPMCIHGCKWSDEPGLDDITLFMFFGVPMKECPRPRIPSVPEEEPPLSVMYF